MSGFPGVQGYDSTLKELMQGVVGRSAKVSREYRAIPDVMNCTPRAGRRMGGARTRPLTKPNMTFGGSPIHCQSYTTVHHVGQILKRRINHFRPPRGRRSEFAHPEQSRDGSLERSAPRFRERGTPQEILLIEKPSASVDQRADRNRDRPAAKVRATETTTRSARC